MPRFDKILCPVDFDQNSLPVLRLAAELTQERKATLYLLHVVGMPPGPEVALPFDQMEAAARAKLKKLAQRIVGRKTRYDAGVAMGDPASEVLRIAKRRRVNLIVMATHGRKGLNRLILGSVAERVVREAVCPVLTVKPKGKIVGRSTRQRATSSRTA